MDRQNEGRSRPWTEFRLAASMAAAVTLLVACGGSDEVAGPGDDEGPGGDPDPPGEEFSWDLPPGFPEPRVPDSENNPMTEEKVELGRRLFYDQRLSANRTQSCASCHQQELAFTDGREVGIGSTEEPHPRASMSLANVGYQPVLTWMNPEETSLV
ncbi:MAG: cytochrome c peroxidase, partial [Gemmatimonadota bacterium]